MKGKRGVAPENFEILSFLSSRLPNFGTLGEELPILLHIFLYFEKTISSQDLFSSPPWGGGAIMARISTGVRIL